MGDELMKTEEITLKYPTGFEHAVHLSKEELEQHIRLMAALKMFELGKVSSGKAAELAGMSRIEFIEVCGRYRVSVFNYSPEKIEEEIKKDLESAKGLTGQ
jgi:predicted HTH domain antitoxin